MEKGNINRLIVILGFSLIIAALPTYFIFASIGVGIGTGKIIVEEKLIPGGIYDLPGLPVINTGDTAGEYGITIEYHQNQPQIRPNKEWFIFEPATFSLEPGRSKLILIRLNLPLKTEPGEYFAYIEAHPIIKDVAGQATVGIAAATKLYFTVKPATWWEGIIYRVKVLITKNAPFSYWIICGALLIIIILILRKFININVGLSFKKKRG